MSTDKEINWSSVANKLLLTGAVLGLLWGGGKWAYSMTELISTKDFHNADVERLINEFTERLKPIQESVTNSEQNNVVDRIRRLVIYKCRNGNTTEFDDILNAQISRYKKLVGREFKIRDCEYYLEEGNDQ